MYEIDSSAEGNLQDIAGQESKFDNIYMHFESKKQKKKRIEPQLHRNQQPAVHVTSYLADSDTAVTMTEEEIINDARNKTRGADMISAFFIAPDDEVNEIDKAKYTGKPIVVGNLNEDLARNERYSSKEASNTLTNNILAPIQAALSLSHEEGGPLVERQVLQKQPVYKTYIEIQKSIPYEIRDIEEPKDQHVNNELGLQTTINNEVVHHPALGPELGLQQPLLNNDLNNGYVRNQLRSPLPVYYRYPMYYLPNRYIGNYIMRHSHENTGYHQQMPVRPILPVQYVLARYQPQVYGGFLLTHPYYVNPTTNAASDSVGATTQIHEATVFDSDQSGLPAEQRAQYAPPHSQHPPFRPSHPVYASQYPPYTYRVLSTMRSRSGHARTARSKQLCIEYGGFKPPMVPSVQIDDDELNDPVKDKTESDDKAGER
ncbi:unnamed protein product [Nesidiocoris tenuis]|nr:unnamed protein product [Nesidiocoris tenuis]